MCLAIPGRVIELLREEAPRLAVVEVAGVRRQVSTDLLADEPLAAGDWVLIHVGFAMSRIGEEAAAEQMRTLSALGEEQQALEEIEGYRLGEEPAS